MDLHAELLVVGAVVVTGWKLIGWSGALCFGLRWVVQAWHRQRTRDARLPSAFWWISLGGAGLTLSYFCFGQPDSVGVLQSLPLLLLAGWNLSMDRRARQES
jgi:lipid-A-disaccharide synthase-like uncharacterized protein